MAGAKPEPEGGTVSDNDPTDDQLRAASELFVHRAGPILSSGDINLVHAIAQAIADAVAVDRERCAALVESEAARWDSQGPQSMVASALYCVADEIRDPT